MQRTRAQYHREHQHGQHAARSDAEQANASAPAPSEAHHDDRRDLIAATATMKIHQPKLSGGG